MGFCFENLNTDSGLVESGIFSLSSLDGDVFGIANLNVGLLSFETSLVLLFNLKKYIFSLELYPNVNGGADLVYKNSPK